MVSGNFRYERPNGSPRINVNPMPSQPFDLFEPERTLAEQGKAVYHPESIDDIIPDISQIDMGNDPCCGEAKEMWRDGLAEGWGERFTNDPDGGMPILEAYDAMSCEEFRQALENRFDAQGYSLMGGGGNKTRSLTRPGMNPNSPRSNHSWEDSLANRVLEAWDKCSEASLPTDQASQDMGFYASDDPFEAGWNAILKYSFYEDPPDDAPFERLVTTFSGMGAPETAAMRVGAKPALSIDGWDESIRTLNENYPGEHKQLMLGGEGGSVEDVLGMIHDATTGADSWAYHASPPCTDISSANSNPNPEKAMQMMYYNDALMAGMREMENPPVVMTTEQAKEMRPLLLNNDFGLSPEFMQAVRTSPNLEGGMFGSPTVRQRMFAVEGSKATPQTRGRDNYRSINDFFPDMQQEWEESENRPMQLEYLARLGNVGRKAFNALAEPTINLAGQINPGKGGASWLDDGKQARAWKHLSPTRRAIAGITSSNRPALTHVRYLTRPEVMQIQGWTPEEAKAFTFPQKDNQGYQHTPKTRRNIIDQQLGNTLNPNIMENIFRNVGDV